MSRGKVPVSYLSVCAAAAVMLGLMSSFDRDVTEATPTVEADVRHADETLGTYAEQPPEPEATTEQVTSIAITQGENLSSIFQERNLPPGELQRILASGSLAETETFLILAQRLRMAREEQIKPILAQAAEIGRMLNGLKRALRSRA